MIYKTTNCVVEEYNDRLGYIWSNGKANGYCLLGDENLNPFEIKDWQLLEKYWKESKELPIFISDAPKTDVSISEFGYGSKFEHVKIESLNLSNPILQKVLIFSRNPEKTFFVYGNTGLGKTHICAWLTRLFMEKSWNFYSGDIKRYLEELYTYQEINGSHYQILNKWKKSKVLIIDDFGNNKITDWRIEVFLDLLDHRWSNDQATFITSNLNPSEIKDFFGQRIASRLLCSHIIQLKGKDKRF